MTSRRTNDFDSFINANPNKMHSPRNLPLNINNFNTLPNPIPDKSQRHVSPNRISNTSKPMISPSNSHRNPMSRPKQKMQNETGRDHYCPSQNHPLRKADFAIKVEGIDTLYCEVCAAHAASQGFTVRRINKRQRTVPNYPQYLKNQRYIQGTQFMNNILELQNQFRKIQARRGREHYKQQVNMLNSFYDSLQQIVQKMRQDHIADLTQQCEQNAAREAMGIQNLKIHLDQLNEHWQDIENNMQKIVQEISQGDFVSCMETYNNDLKVFSHKLEQFQDQKQKCTTYTQNDLNKKIHSFQTKLMQIWDQNNHHSSNPTSVQISNKALPQVRRPASQSNYQSNPSTTIRNVHQMLPKQVVHKNGEGQDPFRNLFPEQEVERLPEASPQFKAF